MIKSTYIFLLVLPLFCFGQKKIKIKNKTVAWTYQISSKTTEPEELAKYSNDKNTKLDQTKVWDEINHNLQHADVDNYQTQTVDVYSAMFRIKNRDCKALNDASDIAESAIESLSNPNKRKRKTLDEVRPDLEYARDYFTDKLTRTKHPTIQNVVNANLATVLLLLGDIESAKFHIQNIPEVHELKTKIIWEDSFTYFLQGLVNAIALKEQYGTRAFIKKF